MWPHRSGAIGGGNGVNIQVAAGKESQAKEISGDKRTRKSESVFLDLKRQIFTGALTSDSPITEQSLAQEYACSQSTIREALMALQEYGLVVRRGYQGTFVTQTSNTEAVILLRLRLNIETAVIEQVIDKMSASVMEELRSLAEDYEVARLRRDKLMISQSDVAFHMALLRVADMPILEPVLMRTLLHLHLFIVTSHRNNMVWSTHIEASHEALLDAIESGDKAAANRLVIEHATANSIEVKTEIREEVFAKI